MMNVLDVDMWIDVYLFGVLLFELLCGLMLVLCEVYD